MAKLNKYAKPSSTTNDFTRVNYQIRISPVLVVKDDKNLGLMSTKDAIQMAKDDDLDLVEVSPNARPPVCKIMDFGKYKYEKSIKDKEKKQCGSHAQTKEIRFRPVTGMHDLDTKIKLIRGFLESGHKVALQVRFKARELTHQSLGFDMLSKVITSVEDLGEPQQKPKMEGRNIACFIEPKKAK